MEHWSLGLVRAYVRVQPQIGMPYNLCFRFKQTHLASKGLLLLRLNLGNFAKRCQMPERVGACVSR